VTDIQMTDAAVLPADDQPSRLARLTNEVRELKVGRAGGRIAMGEHTMMTIGGIIAPIGLVLVLIGWWGAARTPNLFEQIPYLISGGLFGLSLVILGGFLYFAHWLTQLIKETRAQAEAVALAFGRLEEVLGREVAEVRYSATQPVPAVAPAAAPVAEAPAVGSRSGKARLSAPAVDTIDDTAVLTAPGAATSLVATAKGTMAHRPDCVVVAGKTGLRSVTPGEDLQACKLCDSGAV
jgi:multisubunit Na+/H+ antiporter MnhG subunit